MSCLFDSLTKFVNNINPRNLRACICNFLESNPKLMDGLSAEEIILIDSNMKLDKYIFLMRQYSTMGGAIEIRAFCFIFNKNVKVLSEPNNKIIEFIINEKFPFAYLRWTGCHYDPLLNGI